MPRAPSPRLTLRTWILPAMQAILTGGSTGLAVILVFMWRPERTRYIPFYSDATHNDPERILLAIGENLACFLMPLVATAEYLQQSRLALDLPRSSAPKRLPFLAHRVSTHSIVKCNFVFTAVTSLFFFVTANVPSKYPYTPPHQFAASALIFMYAVQATCKAALAATFFNYEPFGGDDTNDEEASMKSELELGADRENSTLALMTENGPLKPVGQEDGRRPLWSLWKRHHMKLRLLLAIVLWTSLVTTWVCYMGRLVTRGMAGWQGVRKGLATWMAVTVHLATASCVTLMGVSAVDLRGERVALESVG